MNSPEEFYQPTYDEEGSYHSENDEPSVIDTNDGTKYWYKHGNLHRNNGPAVIYTDGAETWFQDGQLHRLDGPAETNNHGLEIWAVYGKYHRIDGPAYIGHDGYLAWWIGGARHRIDGPAEIFGDGTQRWCLYDITITNADAFKVIAGLTDEQITLLTLKYGEIR